MLDDNPSDTKKCVICGDAFSRIDFPQCFGRMVTCGNPYCEGERRKQRWKNRHPKDKKKK